ncbi:hypothetical protein OJ967_27865 (plasmid) [Peribacillus frigoritolerans]|uniref:hypothetical protein n=1 Tax=Peribacillus frigoritolerans TaxID=450367 RepID=UPI002226D806|nr:hypothetical protein [Peribacillus frigoritolerans]UYZ01850.1 hypothetical protein OJ967_27865 [Peribacillus frigoritolerans]
MKAVIYHYSFVFRSLAGLFDVLGILVLMFNYVVKGGSLCRSYNSKDYNHVNSTAKRSMEVRKFSTLNNVSTKDGCDSCGEGDGAFDAGGDGGSRFSISPENIVEVFNAKAMKNLSATDVRGVKNEKIRDILRRVQDLMENAEHSYNAEQRSTSLESGSIFLRSALSIIKNKEYNS